MSQTNIILKEIKILKREIKKCNLYRKRIYTLKEASIVIGVSYSQIQKLVAQRKIPHSKPTGKLIFIRRRDLENFIMSNYIHTQDDIESFVRNKLLINNNNKLE